MIINLVEITKDDVKRGLTAKLKVSEGGFEEEDLALVETLVPMPNDPVHCFELEEDSQYDLSGVYGFEDDLENYILVFENSDVDDYITDLENTWDDYEQVSDSSEEDWEDDSEEEGWEDDSEEYDSEDEVWEDDYEDEGWEDDSDEYSEDDVWEDSDNESTDDYDSTGEFQDTDDDGGSTHDSNKHFKPEKEQQKVDFSSLGLNFDTEDKVDTEPNPVKTDITQNQTNVVSSEKHNELEKEDEYPSNPIEFLKLHPRTLETEVKKYCNAKEVDRYINRGLIQRFKGRLFI